MFYDILPTYSIFQCCGSRMFIPDPEFYPFRIPDSEPGSRIPTTATKELVFFWSHKYHNEQVKKENMSQFTKNYRFFTKKNVTKLSKIWVWDPGSGKKPIPDPGPRIQGSKRHRISDPGSATLVYFSCQNPKSVWIRIRIGLAPLIRIRTETNADPKHWFIYLRYLLPLHAIPIHCLWLLYSVAAIFVLTFQIYRIFLVSGTLCNFLGTVLFNLEIVHPSPDHEEIREIWKMGMNILGTLCKL